MPVENHRIRWGCWPPAFACGKVFFLWVFLLNVQDVFDLDFHV